MALTARNAASIMASEAIVGITLQLDPDLERSARESAALRGLSLEDYLRLLIEETVAASGAVSQVGDLSRFEADMDQVASGSDELPVLREEAFSREHIYSDRE